MTEKKNVIMTIKARKNNMATVISNVDSDNIIYFYPQSDWLEEEQEEVSDQ